MKWDMVKLGEVLNIKNGRDYKAVSNPEGQYPVYGSGGIMGYADKFLCEGQTVVIGRKGSINNPIYVENPFWNVDTAFGLVPSRNILSAKYLFYFCKKYDFQKLNTTVTIPSLTKAKLLDIQIPLPPLDEQKRIANILDQAYSIIKKRKESLQLADDYIKSVFLEMFGDPVINPMGWDKKPLAELTTKIGSGSTPRGGKESYCSDGISLVRSLNVHLGFFKYEDLAYIDDKQAYQLRNVILEEKDVLLNITGASVARSCVLPNDVLPARVNQHVAILRCNLEQLAPEFLNCLLINRSYQKLLNRIAESNGATRQALTKEQLENLQIISPPLVLQNKFAKIVEQVEKTKERMQAQLNEAETLFKALQQEFFG